MMSLKWIRHGSISQGLPVAGRLLLLCAVLVVAQIAPRSWWMSRWSDRAAQAAQVGETQQAIDAYGQIQRVLGPQVFVTEQLVQITLMAQRYREAQAYLYALTAQDGWTDARLKQLSQILEAEGDPAGVADLLATAATLTSHSPRALRRLAEYQIDAVQWDQVEITLRQLANIAPGDGWTLFQLGMFYAPQNPNFARAYLEAAANDLVWAERAAAVQQSLADYDQVALTDEQTRIGIVLVGLEEWPYAERALTLALEANAVNPTARAYLGFVRDRQGRDGLPDLEAALNMNPTDPLIYYLVGMHWRQVESQQKAYEAFTRAYWLAPDNPALAVEVGTSLQNLDDLSGAEQWFKIAIDLAPDDSQWRRLLAMFYADEAYALDTGGLSFIEDTATLLPDDPDVLASLGWAYDLTGDAARSYEMLNRAVSIDPSRVRSRYYFGVVLERRNDQQGAVDSYEFVLENAAPSSRFGVLAARALQRLGVVAGS